MYLDYNIMISYIYSVIFLIFRNYPIVFIFVLLFLYHDLSLGFNGRVFEDERK